MKEILFLIIILILAIGLPVFYNINKSVEGYSNYTLENAGGGAFPSSLVDVLVQDTYPITGMNGVSAEQASNMWWHYPIFKVGSYSQITNNIRYPNNPDQGTCMPAEFCGSLYKEKMLKQNYSKPLPPANFKYGTRVNYFSTHTNMLPFRSNEPNILY